MSIERLCLNCNKITNNPKFCSKSCSAKYTNKLKTDKCVNRYEKKTITCLKCLSEFDVNIRSNNRGLCLICKKIYKLDGNIKIATKRIYHSKKSYRVIHRRPKTCKICGLSECKKIGICKRHQALPGLIKYFGFNESTLGTINCHNEFERIKSIVHEQYYVDKMSIPVLYELYGHYDIRNFKKILKYLEIDSRTISSALSNSFLTGRSKINTNSTSAYKAGYHITWDNKQIYYRSSYELDYAQKLDAERIKYEVENLRIEYWDSQQMRYRIAIPDFYLPETNTIVEVKSSWTYNEQNMKDRVSEFQKLGYNFQLIYEKRQVSLIDKTVLL